MLINSLSFRLSLYVIVVTLAAVMLVSGVALTYTYRKELKDIRTTQEVIEDVHLAKIIAAVWDLSSDHIEFELETLKTLKHISWAEIDLPGGRDFSWGEQTDKAISAKYLLNLLRNSSFTIIFYTHPLF